MLAFYWAFFNLAGHPGLRKMLFGITAFVVASYLTILFDDTFFCGTPVSVQWSQEEGACSVFYAPEPFILNFTLNLACYLAVYAVPVVLLMKGVLRSSAGVGLTFALGALTIASSIVRFACLKIGTGQENLVCKFAVLCATCSVRDNQANIVSFRSFKYGGDDSLNHCCCAAGTQATCEEYQGLDTRRMVVSYEEENLGLPNLDLSGETLSISRSAHNRILKRTRSHATYYMFMLGPLCKAVRQASSGVERPGVSHPTSVVMPSFHLTSNSTPLSITAPHISYPWIVYDLLVGHDAFRHTASSGSRLGYAQASGARRPLSLLEASTGYIECLR